MKRMSQRQKKAHTHAYTHAHVASGAYPEGLQELELLLELLELLLLLDHAVKLRLDVTHRGLEIFRQLRQHSVQVNADRISTVSRDILMWRAASGASGTPAVSGLVVNGSSGTRGMLQ